MYKIKEIGSEKEGEIKREGESYSTLAHRNQTFTKSRQKTKSQLIHEAISIIERRKRGHENNCEHYDLRINHGYNPK